VARVDSVGRVGSANQGRLFGKMIAAAWKFAQERAMLGIRRHRWWRRRCAEILRSAQDDRVGPDDRGALRMTASSKCELGVRERGVGAKKLCRIMA
jgi:hypothetical protein